MTLKLHNTLTRNLDEFTPQDPDRVLVYSCGPTVYDSLHVGNWAAYIYWDVLVRVLLADGYTVERVINITDVGHLVSDEDEGEDKLQKGAKREGKTAWEIAEFYTNDFIGGMKRLNMVTPEHFAKATDYIDQQLALVRVLKEKGYTYQISDGIYFDTAKFPTYADFAGLNLYAQQAGARVEFNPEKRSPSDFALWKFSPVDERRDMEWDTPVDLLTEGESRKGFPGWHLECSAMAMDILGNTLDIHTGGIDHIPVHHTNEIAQSESASGVQFSNYWLHNNHLKVNGTKISKSLSNGYTLHDLEEKGFTPLDYRMFVLHSHYESEGNFTFENLTAAKQRLANWRNIAALRHQIYSTLESQSDRTVAPYAANQAILEALNNNLGTPQALTIIDEAFDALPLQNIDEINRFALNELLETIDQLLGLNLLGSTPDIQEDAKRLIVEREQARTDKNWTRSDELRDQLQRDYHIAVHDTAHGTIWSYA